jgi:transcriptional repressor OPI1
MLQPHPSPSSHSHADPISPAHMRTLTDVRRDVVHTIRQVVDVVSKYAGGALPEPARTRVRGFILKLPQRWASATSSGVGAVTVPAGAPVGSVGTAAEGRKRNGRYQHHRERSASLSVPASATESPGSSRATSPMASPRTNRSSMIGALSLLLDLHIANNPPLVTTSREPAPHSTAEHRRGSTSCSADFDTRNGKP